MSKTICCRLKSLLLSFKPFYFLLLTFYFLLLFGCGYTIQTKANLPFDAITIGKIDNKTFEPKLQDRFSRSLAETFAEYGFIITTSARYKLEGEIIKFELKAMAEKGLVATQYEVITKANFRLVDTATGKSLPIIAESPFITYFESAGKLENILAQKELSTIAALRNLSQEVARHIIYSMPEDATR